MSGVEKKSVVASVLLTCFLGPFGLFYLSVGTGIVAVFIWVYVMVTYTDAVWTILVWFIAVPWAFVGTHRHNRRLRQKVRREILLIQEVRGLRKDLQERSKPRLSMEEEARALRRRH